jgi:hypothetical protein
MSAPHTTENLTIHLEVKDYASWRTGYNARKTTHRSAGLTTGGVFRNPDDPNDVVVLQDVSDVEKLTSEDLKVTMLQMGVIGSPTVRFAA